MLFTSESVTQGHPDKMADQISDAILDAVLAEDPNGRVACETLLKTGLVALAGEITTTAILDYPTIVRQVVTEIGYADATWGFDANTCAVICAVERQSPDIAMGVDRDGAGDQGMMFGYACRETPELMPAPITYSHQLTRKLTDLREDGTLPFLRPDGKAQVSVQYDENNQPRRIDTVVVSTQHAEEVTNEQIQKDLSEKLVHAVLPAELLDEQTVIHINPTGRFVIGGPMGDAGLTGRKIIVDTYGGMGRHGGGAFSGKDPTKVDRSAAYMARYVAKNVVAAGLADRCELQLAYAIGVAAPVSVLVETFGTNTVAEEKISMAVRELPADAEGHHRDARPAPADLPADRGVRPLRPRRVLVGAHGPRRRAQGRRLTHTPERKRAPALAGALFFRAWQSPALDGVRDGRRAAEPQRLGRDARSLVRDSDLCKDAEPENRRTAETQRSRKGVARTGVREPPEILSEGGVDSRTPVFGTPAARSLRFCVSAATHAARRAASRERRERRVKSLRLCGSASITPDETAEKNS